MADQHSASDAELCSRDSVCERVQAILRAAQRAGWTDDALEGLSGVPARTIKSYRIEGKEPSLSNALSLAVVIGPKALNPILALIGYVAKPLDEADAVNPNQIIASLLPHVSTIATAAADGRIDHIEQPGCRQAADEIIATVMPLSSAGEAA
jgi:hypothetical protein